MRERVRAYKRFYARARAREIRRKPSKYKNLCDREFIRKTSRIVILEQGMEVLDERKKGIAEKIKESDFIKRVKGVKNVKIIAAIFIIAIALIIYSTVASSKASEKNVSTMTNDEKRLSAILSSVDGAGEVETMITCADGKIVGVLIIADGAKNPLVRIRLLKAGSSALGVDEDVVSVLSRKSN